MAQTPIQGPRTQRHALSLARHDHKLQFHQHMLEESMRWQRRSYHVILMGDINFAAVDLTDTQICEHHLHSMLRTDTTSIRSSLTAKRATEVSMYFATCTARNGNTQIIHEGMLGCQLWSSKPDHYQSKSDRYKGLHHCY